MPADNELAPRKARSRDQRGADLTVFDFDRAGAGSLLEDRGSSAGSVWKFTSGTPARRVI